MYKTSISDGELESINLILTEVVSKYDSVEETGFLKDAPLYAHEFPRRLRILLSDFKTLEPAPGLCLISGFRIDGQKIGRTPSHWQNRSPLSPAIREEALLILLGSLLGEVFAWSTQQNGYVIHDILPIKEHANEQLGAGCEQTLWWHNEDAFHACRGDYLGMMCLRNPDNVATTVASINSIELDDRLIDLLFEQRFSIRPDESHLEKNKATVEDCQPDHERSLDAAYQRIKQQREKPERLAVLFGDRKSPYIRIDPYFMDPLEDDAEATLALNALIRSVDQHLSDLVLTPGDIVFIDNFRVVHGRKPFHARYDGTDRWLKRINITRDLRKSRGLRPDVSSRILY